VCSLAVQHRLPHTQDQQQDVASVTLITLLVDGWDACQFPFPCVIGDHSDLTCLQSAGPVLHHIVP
jgi:hypothetical protein